MDVKLKVLAGTHSGKEIALTKSKFVIGRAEDCHLRAGSELISRHHCAIVTADSYVGVQDFKSRNGTTVNGEPVVGERELKAGDRLQVGPLEFEIVIDHRVGGKKRPAVKGLADVAARTAEPSRNVEDDDISRWLGEPEGRIAIRTQSTDTQSIKASDTETMRTTMVPTPDDGKTSKSGKTPPPAQKTPGKLPTVDQPKAKDSREAAAAVLKQMSRRR